MQMVRSNFVCRFFVLMTSIVFLNMSMILVEISALELAKDKTMVENLAKQLAGCSSEEETDMADEDVTVKELDLMGSNLLSLLVSELIDITQLKIHANHGAPLYGNYEIFCPPPEA